MKENDYYGHYKAFVKAFSGTSDNISAVLVLKTSLIFWYPAINKDTSWTFPRNQASF